MNSDRIFELIMNKRKIVIHRIKYVNPAEMAEIQSSKKLQKKLKIGYQDAEAVRGKFAKR